MQPREKISKSSWMVIEGVKDSVSTNITTALRSGQIKVEAAQVPTLLALIAASIDEGYHKSHKTFMKTVDGALADAETSGMMPGLQDPELTKKK